jgi:2-keto-4-pentenoate hydratase/2-oxohepta-3-ene-1,7-dioic acid hydratase in catechol pathway
MRKTFVWLASAVLGLGAFSAGAQQAATPFKLGTFERQGSEFLGIVLGDGRVIDFGTAHAAVRTGAATLPVPRDMKDLIARYDAGLGTRIRELIAAAGSAGTRPAFVYELASVAVRPPLYPTTMLNVAVNYREHDVEMARVRVGSSNTPGAPTAGAAPPGTESAPGIWQRSPDDTRWNPYMFLKSPGAIVASGEPVRLPPGRTQIEWECELGVVIGKPASRVRAADALDYVFGYTLENDMSDRGGRGDTRFGGSDWLVGKNHDTFAPLGPFITPKEFVADVGKLGMTFVLNGERLQEGTTAQMIHTVPEQLVYASNIITLRPGDVIATGTPPGVGSARNPPILLKAGDRMDCSYDGIGTLTNPVVAPSAPP